MKRLPWLPDEVAFLKAAQFLIDQGERGGMLCVPQFFVVQDIPLADGGEAAGGGRLRYTVAKVLDDLMATEGRATVSFVVRYFDPDDATEMDAYGLHQQAAEREGAA